MNETEAEQLLRRVRDEITLGPVPTAQLLAAGRQVRRRRAGQIMGVVAAVSAVLAGGLLLRSEVTATTTPDVADPARSDAAPVAPPGTRLVGKGRVVVAVPEDWATNAVKCGQPQRDTVAFSSDGNRGCIVPRAEERSWLELVSTGSAVGATWSDQNAEPAVVHGMSVQRIETDCVDSTPLVAQCSGALLAPAADAIIVVRSPDRAVVERVLRSVQVLPEGWTTVPYDRNAGLENTLSLMQRAELDVEVTQEHRSELSPGVLLYSEPALGSAVSQESTVTVTVSGGPEPGSDESATQIVEAERTSDGGLYVTVSTCQGYGRAQAVETADAVTITAYSRAEVAQTCSDPVPVELKTALGDRALVDGSTGDPLVVHPEPQPHDFTLLTHCGIKYARFAGEQWQTDLLSDGSGNPPPGWDNPFQAGEMTLLDQDTSIFTSDGNPALTFAPTEAEPPLCG